VANWGGDFDRWLAPFLARLGHKARRRMCPLYVAGLIGPGDRKSVEPMASRSAPGDYDQLHHFIASGVWNEALLEEELAIQADKLIGGARAVLVVDDTALPKKGSHSVGVAPQYASALGKTAGCQTLVSLTLARDEVPVMIGLRLFLPESWIGDADRMAKARVPESLRAARTKPEIALAEIDRIRAAGVRFATVLVHNAREDHRLSEHVGSNARNRVRAILRRDGGRVARIIIEKPSVDRRVEIVPRRTGMGSLSRP
jgi:SRSO17 transposase